MKYLVLAQPVVEDDALDALVARMNNLTGYEAQGDIKTYSRVGEHFFYVLMAKDEPESEWQAEYIGDSPPK